MRLIDADELTERMLTHCELCQHNDKCHPCRRECDWHEALDEVDDSPDINIIHCKDCKNYLQMDCPMGLLHWNAPPPDGYCYKVEKQD